MNTSDCHQACLGTQSLTAVPDNSVWFTRNTLQVGCINVPVHGCIGERRTGHSHMLWLVVALSPLAGGHKISLVGCCSMERQGGS